MTVPADIAILERSQPARFDVDQFLRMFGAGMFGDRPMELVHGEIIELGHGCVPHSRMLSQLTVRLFERIAVERVYISTYIRLDNRSVRAFDLALLHPDIEPGDELQPSEVLLGVEVAHSSLDRDLGEKMRHYAASAIEHYLVVDVEGERLILMSDPADGAYRQVIEKRFGEPLDLPGDLGSITLD